MFFVIRKLEPVHDFAREGDADGLLALIANGASVNSKGVFTV